MYVHAASIFNYRQYQADIKKFVEQVDRGEYHSFQDYIIGLISRFQQVRPATASDDITFQDAVLFSSVVQLGPLFAHDLGCLPHENTIRQNNPSNNDIGQWFLISLSEYLSPCDSPSGNWKVVFDALYLSGWNLEDCEVLFKGHPTSKLLKPNAGGESPWPLENTDPYWLWLHPSRGRAGWLAFDDLRYFHRMLIDTEEKIMSFDLHRLPEINSDNPVVIKEYTKYLQMGYRSTLQMVENGIQKGQGLFMSVSIM